ncbi:MAG TPA: PAS domain S-box protein [Bacteroidota bacterium]|jgi:PAS domain S-box-containing protein|nr:PAS domain S-box protein [Bacteroidota bacterium]
MAVNDPHLEEYKQYVSGKLRALAPFFAKASRGDFSENIEIPHEDDEFTELYLGVQAMLGVIRDQLTELRKLNESLEGKVVLRTAALEEAQQLAHIGSWEWDIPANSVSWSDELYRIHGLKPREAAISYESFLQRVHPDDRDTVRGNIEKANNDHQPFSFEHRIDVPGRGICVLHARGQVVIDETGKPIKMFGTAQDITERRRFEDALRESEERYRSLIETAKDVVITLSRDGTITSLNPAFESITGFKCEKWLGKPFADILHPDDLPVAMQRFQKILQGESLPSHEWRVRKHTGEYLVGEVQTTPQIRNGKVVGVLGIARDVTARVRAEEALRQSEIRFRSVWENSVDGMRLTDEKGIVIAVNEAYCKLVELETTDLVGRPLTITYAGNEDVEQMLLKYRQRFAERKIATHTERFVTLGSGKAVFVEVTNSFIDLEQGQALLLGIFRNTTERKLAEEALIESEERYRNLFEHARDVIFTISLGGTITALSPAFEKITGWSRQEWIGKRFAALIHPQDMKSTMEIFRRVMRKEQGGSFDIRILAKSGQYLTGDFMTAPLIQQGQVAGAFGIARDITDRRQTEETIRASHQQLREKLEEVERLNQIMMGREERIVELKEEIEALRAQSTSVVQERK